MEKYGIILVFVLFIGSCRTSTPEEVVFKNECLKTFGPGAWMKMREMKAGEFVGDSCWGCMVDMNTHVCSLEEFQFVKG